MDDFPGPFDQVNCLSNTVLLIRDAQRRAPAFQGFLQVRVTREGFDLQELVQDGRDNRGFSSAHWKFWRAAPALIDQQPRTVRKNQALAN
jgi:hypothetical protein